MAVEFKSGLIFSAVLSRRHQWIANIWPSSAKILSLLVIMIVGSFSTAGAQLADRRDFTLATGAAGEVPHTLGVTLAALVKLKLLPLSNIDLNARNTSGAQENIDLLRAGIADFVVLSGLDARRLIGEAARAVDAQPAADITMIANLWRETYHIFARKALVTEGRVADIQAIDGPNLAVQAGDTDVATKAASLLGALVGGEAPALLNLDAALQGFLGGELDVFVVAGKITADADLNAFLARAGDAIQLLEVTKDDLEIVNGVRGAKAWSSADAGGFTGGGPKQSFALNHFLAAAAVVEDDAVYSITRTIFDNLPILQGMHPLTEDIGIAQALDGLILPAHPGTERYYREIGLALPEPVRISNLASNNFLARFASTEEARLQLANDNISILGGQDGQTIGRFTSELASSLDIGTRRILGMSSPDTANNIAQVLYARGIDNAFVPLDVLDYAVERNVYPDLQSKLVYTTELFTQEFHLIVRDDIQAIEDLLDQPVNLGTFNSGSAFTGSFVFDSLNIPVLPVYVEPGMALSMLEKGDIAATVIVAGKPAPLIEGLAPTGKFRLLPVPALEGNAYRPATISAIDYPNLLGEGETLDTFGVRTVLMTYNWREENPRFDAVTAFIASLFDKLATLEDAAPDLHPKWAEIDPQSEVEGWRRFAGAQDWLDNR